MSKIVKKFRKNKDYEGDFGFNPNREAKKQKKARESKRNWNESIDEINLKSYSIK